MQVVIREATLDEQPLLANLAELYQYDFTEFTDDDAGGDGRFGSDFLAKYWTEPGRYPFILRVDGHPAGFALLRRGSFLTDEAAAMDIVEFFVMRKYRRHGVGETFARALWERFPGKWEVREIATNTPAQAFWRAIIGRYTRGRFEERHWDDERWRGPVQFFDNGEIAGPG